jgi:oxygen-independent coproporphyrinogen-3 oxidase
MDFGIYVHIPYCLQRCTYCDFATYEQSKIMPPDQYLQLLFEEIRQSQHLYPKTNALSSIYFGGGTPSLLPAEMIVSIISALEKHGFRKEDSTEITLEINPATVDPRKMEIYLKSGINRFSVGAQSFEDRLLKSVHREHNADQTRQTLKLLQSYGVNYSFDLLFALPTQTLDSLKRDLDEVSSYLPNHISPYCLTVPEGHVLSKNRPLEEAQLEMFELIRQRLVGLGYERYEISNFAQAGFESKHNSLYWQDVPYWGLGLSAHSYSKDLLWGRRYWNASSINLYQEQIGRNSSKHAKEIAGFLPENQKESLEKHQALTDYCHTSLRRQVGLNMKRLDQKFSGRVVEQVNQILELQKSHGNVEKYGENLWRLTEEGVAVSNQVFSALTFLAGEV